MPEATVDDLRRLKREREARGARPRTESEQIADCLEALAGCSAQQAATLIESVQLIIASTAFRCPPSSKLIH